MKPVSDLFPRLMPYVAGCSEPLAQQALVDAAISFCEETLILREQLDPIVTAPGQSEYSLDLPPQHMLGRILSVSLDGAYLQSLPLEPVLPILSVEGRPSMYYVWREDGEYVMRLYPVPDGAYTLSVLASLLPSRDATQLADDLTTTWADTIVHGALAKLHAMPAQPFTDPVAASNSAVYYASRAKRARMDGNIGRAQGALKVQPRSF